MKINYKIFDAWTLKIIMTILMLLDHLRYVYGLLTPSQSDFFTLISRCVAPVFAFLIVDGFFKTKSVKRYNIRMWVWTAIVFIGNIVLSKILLSFNMSLENSNYLVVPTNIAPTLALGLSIISLLDYLKLNKKYRILGYSVSTILFVFGFFMCEWAPILMPLFVVTYYFRNDIKKLSLSYLGIVILSILLNFEVYFFIAFPFIAMYNGKRKNVNSKLKYVFYVFYPVHLWVIILINYFIINS